jgi:hypothetical protein
MPALADEMASVAEMEPVAVPEPLAEMPAAELPNTEAENAGAEAQ